MSVFLNIIFVQNFIDKYIPHLNVLRSLQVLQKQSKIYFNSWFQLSSLVTFSLCYL